MLGDRAAWNRGIATAAFSCVAGISRHELGLRRLTAGFYRSNVASQRAFAKAGFHFEAVRPAHFLLDDLAEDFVLMARRLDQ
jgi:RimJ/RimL family protein N-acetyltransferase